MKTLMETAVESRPVRLFIGGQWRDASDGKAFEQVSPATGQVIGVVSDGTREDARAAVDAANPAGNRVSVSVGIAVWLQGEVTG